jgi:hypothetical protein
MSPVCWAGPLKRGALLHSNFQYKTISLYLTTGPARLAGIPLDSNGAPVSWAEICPCKVTSPDNRAGTKTLFNTKIFVEIDIFVDNH